MAGPLASGPLRVEANGELVSKPYIEMTLATIRAFGGRLERDGDGWRSHGGGYRAAEYAIEPDASAASYLFAAAAITGGSITVPGLGSTALQGDLGFVRVLERMGCRVTQSADRTEVTGGPLVGVDVDMGDISDTVPTLAAVACFASGPTTIRHVAHIRVKETDRVAAVVTELRRAGLTVDEFPDGLRIHPGPLRPARFETYRDHRMAMSLALVGLRSPSVTILDPGCVSKTWPGFWTDLAALRQRAGV
jgi:3-phosphoshikimate 1-carboxyvinyltransferase